MVAGLPNGATASRPNLSVAHRVSQTPEEVFGATNYIRGPWLGEPVAEGRTDTSGAGFTYRFKDHSALPGTENPRVRPTEKGGLARARQPAQFCHGLDSMER